MGTSFIAAAKTDFVWGGAHDAVGRQESPPTPCHNPDLNLTSSPL